MMPAIYCDPLNQRLIDFCVAVDWMKGFIHWRQGLYQLNYTVQSSRLFK